MMDQIKEKPKAAASVREKVKSAPKELLRRGMDDGRERLRSQLRDAAQEGQQDEYGGDRIEDTAAGSLRRMERGAEKLLKERKRDRAAEPSAETVRSTDTEALPVIRTKESEAAGGVDFQPTARQNETAPVAPIKTKDAYVQGQSATQVTELAPEHTQGKQVFIRERGRLSSERGEKRRRIEPGQRTAQVQKPERPITQNAPQAEQPGPMRRQSSVPRSAEKQPVKGSPATKKTQIKEAPRSAGPAGRTARQSVKTAERMERAPAAAGRAASHNAAQSVKTIQAARKAARRYQEAAKSASSAVKKAVSGTVKALRMILAATKSLVAVLAAGGPVTLALLILICLFGLLVASPFGILFTSEPTGEGTVALTTAIAQINTEYAARLDELQADGYDEIIVSGAPPDWREVVAVFAVKTAGTEDGVDVVTLDADCIRRWRVAAGAAFSGRSAA